MTRNGRLLILLCAPVALAVLCSISGVSYPHQTAGFGEQHAYHDSPSSAPLPPTLDASGFTANRDAFVTYSLAAQIEQTLYQVPCYCGCDQEQGHQSLLDCFTSKHGIRCHTCQTEAVFCFVEQRKGKNPAQIREAMAHGKVSKLDFDKYVRRFNRELQRTAR